jgi:class 3 adenylate cyclase/tetratricopeptide (TPR) repeat protein
VDLSGFTRLSERLAGLGRAGAEEVTAAVSGILTRLIEVGFSAGGDVVSFGGDAVLMLFSKEDHAPRACAALARMQQQIAQHGRVESALGPVRLRMSAGAHSGRILVARLGVGHHALAVIGPAASRTVELESLAHAGQVAVSSETATLLPSAWTRASSSPTSRFLHLSRALTWRDATPGLRPSRRGSSEWLDPAVARQVGAAPGAAEHRAAAVAFVEIGGLDGRIAAGDEREAVRALATAAGVVQHACSALEVTWLGVDTADDALKLIITAGAPVAHEDDEERLLRALRQVLDQAPRDVSLRCGAARGHVFAGDVGHPTRRAYTVMGDTVNLAARLMGRAEDREAMVTTALAGLTATRFALEPSPPFFVKGRRAAVQAARLGAVLDRRRGEVAGDLIGREAEVERIREVVDRARAGRVAAMEVVAEGGMGKTHLVHEALRAAAVEAAWGSGDPYGATRPYGALGPALLELLGLSADGPPAERSAALARRVGAIASDLTPWLPLVADAVGLSADPTEETRGLDPGFRPVRLQEVVGELIGRLERGRVMVLDDAQWADESSLTLLRALARGVRGTAVIVLRRPRPEGGPPVLEGADLLSLQPLGREDARRLVLEAAGGRALPDDAIARVLDRAAGHPLFVRQLVAAVDAGVEDLPSDVERLVAARIDRLEPADRLLLRQSAVAGRAVSRAVLSRALRDARLADLTAWKPLQEFVSVEGEEARFRHDLYREAAYAGLPVSRRRELHGRIADALATGDVNHALAPTLALHFHAAGRVEEALRHAAHGARAAAARAAWAEAAELWRIVAESERRRRRPGDDRLARAELERSRALELLGRGPEALACLSRPRPRSRPTTRARRHVARARLQQRLGRVREALRETSLALRAARSDDDAGLQREEVSALLRRASIRQHQGRHRRALELARRAETLAVRGQRGLAMAQVYYALDSLESPDAPDAGRRALRRLGRGGAHSVALGDLLNNLSAEAAWRGRWPQALALGGRSLEVYRQSGDSTGAALRGNNTAEIFIEQGRHDEAAVLLAEARRVFEAAGDHFMVACNDSALATIATRAGDLSQAERHLDAARAALLEVDAEEFVLDADLRRAELLLMQGRAKEALRLSEDCRRRGEELEMGGLSDRWAQRLTAWSLARLGRSHEAEREAAALVEAARADDAPADVLLGLATLAALADARGEPVAPALIAEQETLAHDLGVVRLPPAVFVATVPSPSGP